jgi:hypothetical protein
MRDPETPVAVPVRVDIFEFAGADHDRALEIGTTIVVGARAPSDGLGLSSGQFVGEQRAQLAGTGMGLPLGLARGITPALRT